MTITLYDLAGRDPSVRFSPRCWRTKFALAHKGLEFDAVPWRFREGASLPNPNEGRVPVIEDGGTVVFDSWRIAVYLAETYPEKPPLFGDARGRAHARLLNNWLDSQIAPAILPLIALDLFQCVDPDDQTYFRKDREKRLGRTLEAAQNARDEELSVFTTRFAPVVSTLSEQAWLSGASPGCPDHLLAAMLMWPTRVSSFNLLPPNAAFQGWWKRMMGLYDGLAGKAAKTAT